eukprot:1156851-Pelagomonas_calceolata.AAC.9
MIEASSCSFDYKYLGKKNPGTHTHLHLWLAGFAAEAASGLSSGHQNYRTQLLSGCAKAEPVIHGVPAIIGANIAIHWAHATLGAQIVMHWVPATKGAHTVIYWVPTSKRANTAASAWLIND